MVPAGQALRDALRRAQDGSGSVADGDVLEEVGVAGDASHRGAPIGVLHGCAGYALGEAVVVRGAVAGESVGVAMGAGALHAGWGFVVPREDSLVVVRPGAVKSVGV